MFFTIKMHIGVVMFFTISIAITSRAIACADRVRPV